MTAWTSIDIFFRWLHVITACVVVGCAFFMRVLLPIGIKALDSEAREATFLKLRRLFKFVVHPGILLFLISGTYNAVRNWHTYNNWPGIAHGLFGVHLLLALAIFTISLVLLAGGQPRPNHAKWMRINIVLMFLAVAAASTLKWARGICARSPSGSRDDGN